MSEKRVLLIIGGGVAAFKSLELMRELGRRGVKTRCILTRAGAEFVTPLSVSALSGEKVFTDLFSLDDEAEMGHIQLSRSADLIVVCPATADLMAKAAGGLANDLASTTLLATDAPVMMVPTMNVRMWGHAATKRNVAQLREDGVHVMEPDVGAMACGEFGPGRMPEVQAIVSEIETQLAGAADQALSGQHVLVTAGPTREPLDPVRYLSNHSSGRQGYAIAEALAKLGAQVTLVSGPVSLSPPAGVETVQVETARQMLKACEAALPADVFISVAAVADWRPARAATKKLKIKGAGSETPSMELTENPDILRTLANKRKKRPGLVIGFAAETHDVEDYARAKLSRKNCDWIVANDVSGDVMGGVENEIMLITKSESEKWPRMSKTAVASRLALKIAETLGGADDEAKLAAE